MTSPPLDSTHGRTTSARTVERCRAWHAIIAFGKHTRSNDVGRGMPSKPLDGKHGRTMSGMTCHHRLWTAHSVERRRAWHSIIPFGQHTQSKDIGRGMTSPPLDSTNDRTMSGVIHHQRLWTAHTVERRRAWHAIITFGQDTRRGMRSSPLAALPIERCRAWHAIIAFGQHKRSNDVERGRTSQP
uniref:Uncharacterized protein n=1 Tax=Solanum lycopersicum TaxID=4081 RepID=A0A3Q7HKP6_SOLLC